MEDGEKPPRLPTHKKSWQTCAILGFCNTGTEARRGNHPHLHPNSEVEAGAAIGARPSGRFTVGRDEVFRASQPVRTLKRRKRRAPAQWLATLPGFISEFGLHPRARFCSSLCLRVSVVNLSLRLRPLASLRQNTQPSTRHQPLSRHRRPLAVGVKTGHGGGDPRSLLAEVALINPALLVDDERHHAGVGPFRRPGHQRKSGNHPAIDDVVVFAARRVPALTGQDFEIVAVIRRFFIVHHRGGAMITLHARGRDERTQRA